MKVAILGRSQFLYMSALEIKEAGHSIEAIITAPASPEYTKKEDDFCKLAEKLKVPYFLTRNTDDQDISGVLKGLDICVSFNWISIVKENLISLFKQGVLNAHMGDLPRYRGNACPNWAILNNEKEVVISTHFMEPEKLDCGNIITQDRVCIDNNTYIGDVYKWAQERLPKLFVQALKQLKSDPSYTLKYADIESKESFRCYPRRADDSRIDWKLPAELIHRLIRSSAEPFAGAFAFLNKEKVIIWRAELYNDNEKYYAVPGQISQICKKEGSVIIITGEGKLKLTDIEYGSFRGNPTRIIKSIRTRIE